MKNKEELKRMGTLENINTINIEEYYTEKMPAYENLFITKILFAFDEKISISDIKRKIKENYYFDRMQMSGMLLINIIVVLFLFASMGSWNILWILALLLNILVSGVILRQQKIFSYKFTEEVEKYIEEFQQNR